MNRSLIKRDRSEQQCQDQQTRDDATEQRPFFLGNLQVHDEETKQISRDLSDQDCKERANSIIEKQCDNILQNCHKSSTSTSPHDSFSEMNKPEVKEVIILAKVDQYCSSIIKPQFSTLDKQRYQQDNEKKARFDFRFCERESNFQAINFKFKGPNKHVSSQDYQDRGTIIQQKQDTFQKMQVINQQTYVQQSTIHEQKLDFQKLALNCCMRQNKPFQNSSQPNRLKMTECFQVYQRSINIYNGKFSRSANYYYGTSKHDGFNDIFLYDLSKSDISQSLRVNKPLIRKNVFDAHVCIPDIQIAPKSESFLIYPTFSGMLKMIDLHKVKENYKNYGEDQNIEETRLLFVDQTEEQDPQTSNLSSCALMMKKAIFSLCISESNEKEIWFAKKLGKLFLYDLEYQKVLVQNNEANSIDETKFDINSICCTFDYNIIATAGDAGYVRLWDRRIFDYNSKPIGCFVGHTGGIVCLDFKQNEPQICSSSKDWTIKLWDLRKFNAASEIKQRKMKNMSCRSGYSTIQPQVKQEYCENDYSLMTFKGHHQTFPTLIRCKFSPLYTNQRYVYTGSNDGSCAIYDTKTNHCVQRLKLNPLDKPQGTRYCREVSWHPQQAMILSNTFNGQINIFEHRTSSPPLKRKKNSSDQLKLDSIPE
ncbi:ddb1-and cul4-associated factor 11-like [Stylonychia lemnae]|uniref:Ddb1-and cul4-associated factor 11-like n=1 Tax=Stylonychia lemnae TaxID=5949 RepID=A0A078A2T6_STYLE|nr:ddb1-and cul4-associated factor 11-like [Stylonychia lemnae]|eukprot:CDW76142.1 ddb1-and cul4-associated factor 11-like [Stylonychia lemnae]